jgi:hypothetical protein
MTKQDYITRHPKSTLALRLACNTWPDNTPITIIGGLIAPGNKCSNLYHALQTAPLREYVVGGHRHRGTEGWWIAVA